MKEKGDVRTAFQFAEEARQKAEAMAALFYSKYDLSDSESAFSELVSDEEDEEDESDRE
jgi:hypothetical protein